MTAVLQRPVSSSAATGKKSPHHVVIVGGGFGGLYAAKALGKANVKVTLIDKRNFHLFQPLLYQVATGGLSAGDISSPLRSVLSKQKNVQVLMGEVTGIEPTTQIVTLKNGETVSYDSLIVATGSSHHYFGKDEWSDIAPGMKTIEDALEVRRRIFLAFEAAEKESDPVRREALLTFFIVGGGPTGVELAGALAELAYETLREDFRSINPGETKVVLLEGMDRVLPPYPGDLSASAKNSLEKLGVEVRTNTLVTNIEGDIVTLKNGDSIEKVQAFTVLWAAGIKASPMGKAIADQTGAELDRIGRIIVGPDLSVPGCSNIYIAGDLAHYAHNSESPLPGTASTAMQQGSYLADSIQRRLEGQSVSPFEYKNKGSMAVIGRNEAVADLGFAKMSGFPAWFLWIFVHIYYLVEFDNKLLVLLQWGWHYFTSQRGARLITGDDSIPALSALVIEEMTMGEKKNPSEMAEA
ncbi:FAD dependent oxidoreductase, putative [Synechococcus sp. PCC 7335]|uniref:NAD(P)/FAD-dependent oxidoreductase n=1 Tax=Synechococcus sp. (strain ATCC 29403 / PCC 7335) TaxID=91464 RepID=UPI00017EE815|nr:NAD(P)/FAD-dependent oxidoreductase [Synechococcus sp. PCC 7335]EDX86946.1 FAD dependent oxidoreductase, putative [Synechococcus sp. PCC 7335]